jgi:TolB-like protein
MRYIIILLLLSYSTFAQKARNYTDVTKELADKVIAAQVTAQPQRLAVVPFTATHSSVQASVQFGEYLTETIIGSIAGHPQKIKLFERTRMDAVLKEQEFILTDLMKPAAALKIGQLVPIDAILSGTYTKLKTYIDVSARLIDVESGEITVSYTGRIKMNKNLAALFPANGKNINQVTTTTNVTPEVNVTVNNTVNTNTAASKAETKEEICNNKVKGFRSKLLDLTTQDKIDFVVTEAMKIPFDNECGTIHQEVMYSLSSLKIENDAYKNFLIKTLDTIAYPSADDRAYGIVKFLSTDNTVDDKEWATGLHVLARAGQYSLSSYLTYLISKPTNPAQPIQEARIKIFMNLVSTSKIGLPRPVSYESAFFELMESFHDNQPLRQHTYQTYAGQLKLDDKGKEKLAKELSSMYEKETVPTKKIEVIKWMATFINTTDFPDAHDDVYRFIKNFEPYPYNQKRNEEIKKEFPDSDLKILAATCSKRLATYAIASTYESQKEERINFCVKYGIPIPGVIPTMEEADVILKGNDLDEQMRVVKLLALMNEQPKKIEPSIIGLLSKRSLEDRSKMNKVQALAIFILGNIKTSNSKAIEYMIDVLPHYGDDTEEAKEALVKIGKPAVLPVKNRLDKTTNQDGGLQYQLIVPLGKIGKDAAPAVTSIQRVLTINKNNDVQYAGEAALQAIR